MAEEEKQEQFLSDFEADGASTKTVLTKKAAYISKYGLTAYTELVSRSIRKQRQAR